MIIQRLYSLRSNAPEAIDLGEGIMLKKAKLGFLGRLLGHIKFIRKEQEKGVVYEAFFEDNEIGFIQIFDEGKGVLNISCLYVDKDQRGKGIATLMMEQIIKYAKNSGYSKVTLEVPGASKDARHIYEKLGFKEVRVEKDLDLTDMELDLRKQKTYSGVVKETEENIEITKENPGDSGLIRKKSIKRVKLIK